MHDNVDLDYKGHRLVESCDTEAINNLYKNGAVKEQDVPHVKPFKQHEFLIIRNESSSVLAVYCREHKAVVRVDKIKAYGITNKNVEQLFALNALTNTTIPLVTITGKAGTGKTLLAIAAALEQKRGYRQIMVARPVIPLSNNDMGYLPGDITSKLDPYMAPLFDSIGVIKDSVDSHQAQLIDKMREEDKLIIEPLAYIRGRSLIKKFLVVDEAQNLTSHEVKTIITRASEGTKIVLTGDVEQIDHPKLNKHTNGLSHIMGRLQDENLYCHIHLEKGERSPLSILAADKL